MKLIYFLLNNSWLTVLLTAITGLLSGASSTGLISIINLILNRIESSIDPQTNSLLWIFVALCCLLIMTTVSSMILVAHLTQEIILNLRMELSKRILACPLRHLEETGSYRLLAVLTEDIETISNTSSAVARFLVNITLLIGCLIYLSWLSLPISFLLFSLLIFGILIYQLIIVRGKQEIAEAREMQDILFKDFQAITQGTKELKLHKSRQKEFISENLLSAATSFQTYQLKGMNFFAFAAGWGAVLPFVAIGLLLFGLPRITPIPFSTLSNYVLTFVFIVNSLRSILNSLPEFTQASIALEKIKSLDLSLTAQNAEQELKETLDVNDNWTNLNLLGLTYSYSSENDDSSFNVGSIDLTLNRQEIVFIVGGNGSGKSTLVKLITGLYIPDSGVIKISGKIINDCNREWYRQHFSVVFSDFYLFERLLGLFSGDLDCQTEMYLSKLQLDHKVKVHDGILSTTELSQGQRKRLALLTAYLENRPIYVFDEWASDQDPMFKEVFYTQLLPELKNKGKTVLVVTHDDQYFHLADRVLKLDNSLKELPSSLINY